MYTTFNKEIIKPREAIAKCNLLFVFGTLKRGYHNHRRLLRAEFVARAKSISVECAMTQRGGFPLMYLDRPVEGCSVVGEIYRVTEDDMISTDQLEGYPRFYNRRIERFMVGSREVNAWIYYNEDFKSGDFCEEWNA